MIQKSSFKITILASAFVTFLFLLALPYPFNCLTSWAKDCCSCSCPLWIFILLQFFVSLFWYRHLNLEKEKDKLSRAIIFGLIGISVFLIQIFVTKYYIGKGAYESAGSCSRFWIADLFLTLLFIVF